MQHHRPQSNGRESVARALGQTCATVQHLTDLAFAWCSRKLTQVGSGPEPTGKRGILAGMKRFARQSARFVGIMGDAYYEWYGKLKTRKNVP